MKMARPNSDGCVPGQPADAAGWRISDRADDSILSVLLAQQLAMRADMAALGAQIADLARRLRRTSEDLRNRT